MSPYFSRMKREEKLWHDTFTLNLTKITNRDVVVVVNSTHHTAQVIIKHVCVELAHLVWLS